MNQIYIKSIVLSCLFSVAIISGSAQGIYFDPSPTDVTVPGRLYVDVTSSECSCPELLDVNPESNPLYIWLWNPNDPLMATLNGSWDNSNEQMKMQQDASNPNLWYFDFFGSSLAAFYEQPAAVFYSAGMDFLVKEKNGAPSGLPEQKSPDLHFDFEPIGCFEKICPFPTVFFQDEYFVITYDNKQEIIPTLQNIAPDDCKIWYKYSVNGGTLQTLREDTEKFLMDYDGDGVFSKSMIPQEYFGLEEGEELTRIDVFITKGNINAPPFTAAISLFPGCD